MATSAFEKIRNGTPAMVAGAPLAPDDFAAVRRRTILAGCKWDPQVGDVSTLADFPVILSTKTWSRLQNWAEALAAEALLAEEVVLAEPVWLDRLGLPLSICNALGGSLPATPAAARVFRFDFHYTTDGWQISEANSDVPGGFTEASFFTGLMAEHYSHARMTGNPAAAWADAVAMNAVEGSPMALLSAAGYMEDQQIMAFLARLLRERGVETLLAKPSQVAWDEGVAYLETNAYCGALAAVVRFFQGEWLATLPWHLNWAQGFRGGQTPVANPGVAVVTESKRFPLVWQSLPITLPTWQQLLPETRALDAVFWERDEQWLLKSAFCNTGDRVSHPAMVTAAKWKAVCREARHRPQNWMAQRRFEIVPLPTPNGPMFPCIGVYTVNGKVAGAYGRLGRKPLIDYQAVDAAVLVQGDEPGKHF